MSELWTVALFFRPHGRRHNLIFRDKDRARLAFVKINPRVPSMVDDYGCETIVLSEGPLEMAMLVEEGRVAAVELALLEARTQANHAVNSDPQLNDRGTE